MKAANAKDLDAFVSSYADDASVLTPNAPIFTGKQQNQGRPKANAGRPAILA